MLVLSGLDFYNSHVLKKKTVFSSYVDFSFLFIFIYLFLFFISFSFNVHDMTVTEINFFDGTTSPNEHCMKYISVCAENLKVDIEAGQVCVCV